MKKKLIIFGASLNGKWALELFNRTNYYEIIAFADNSPSKQGTSYLGYRIVSAEEAARENCPIIIASQFFQSISNQLETLHVSQYEIYEEEYVFFANILIISDINGLNQLNTKHTHYFSLLDEISNPDFIFIDLNISEQYLLSHLNYIKRHKRSTVAFAIGNGPIDIIRSYFPEVQMLSHFPDIPFIEYLKIKLTLMGKIKLASKIDYYMTENTYYNYTGKYPLQLNYNNNNKVTCSIYDTDNQSCVETTEIELAYFINSKTIAILTQLYIDAKKKVIIVHGLFYALNIPITNSECVSFDFYIINKHNKKIHLKTQKIKENNYNTDKYVYYGGGFSFEIPMASIPPGEYILELSASFYGQVYDHIYFYAKDSVIHKMKFFSFHCTLLELQFIDMKMKMKVDTYSNYLSYLVHKHKRIRKYIIQNILQAKNIQDLSTEQKNKLIKCIKIYPYISWLLPNNIWLIGEKWGDSASDNGFAFFKRVSKEKNIHAYYIITESSMDKPLVDKVGKSIRYLSIKHLIYSMKACALFSNGNSNILLPYESISMFRQKTRYCLQHGITYIKKASFVECAARDRHDYFVTTCRYETEIIRRRFGFNVEQIIEVGLSRNDDMFDQSKDNRIGIMFTWRPHIGNLSELMDSDYFFRLKELVHALSTKDLYIDICVHPKMVEFFTKNPDQSKTVISQLQPNENVTIHSTTSASIVNLKEQCRLLITDYSSLSFDFLYLDKPVIHYIFDYSSDMALKESTLQETLPGKYARSLADVSEYVQEFLNGSLTMGPVAERFQFDYSRNSAEKTMQAALLIESKCYKASWK